MKKLDELDKQILELLRHNEYIKPNISKIAKQLEKPITSIHYRIRRLEENEILKGFYGIMTIS